MTKNEMVESFAIDPDYRAMCIQIAGDDFEDLFQELALIFLEYPNETIRRIDESCLKCFYYTVGNRQYKSRNSAYHRKYRRIAEVIKNHPDDILQASESSLPDEDLINNVNRVLNDLYWYDAGLLKLYAEKGTLKEVSQCTGIPIKSVHNTVFNTKKLVKKKINKYA